jgi:hypothetical protein
MKRLRIICFLAACAVLAEACSNGAGGNGNAGTGGGEAGTGGSGNSAGTGGSDGNAGAGGGAKGSGGIGGKGGAAGSGSSGTSGGGAGGARGGAGGGASPVCGTGKPCPGGKVCVSYDCGPLGNLGGCTAPPTECIDNPCDGGVCDSCPSSVCSSFGICELLDSADIICAMPG